MKFFAPMMFWFAAVIPVVVLFYLLKRRRVVRLVSSTLLWQKFLAESQASAPFQKLRHNWLLLLQLLMLVLVISALARPYFSGQVSNSQLRVVILDASASMQATDAVPSRFEKARAGALELVDALREGSQIIVMQAGAQTEVLRSATSDKGSLREAMRKAYPTDSPTRLKEALRLAETLTRDRADAEIHLFSDGVAPDLGEFERKGLRLVYHKQGMRGENAGVVTLDVKPHPENPLQRAIFTSIANWSTNRRSLQVELEFEGRMLESKAVDAGPRETVPLVYTTMQEVDGVYTVRIKTEDDLVADNQASVVSLLPQPVRALLVTKGNRFLERALKAVPGLELSTATDLTEARPEHDFVVLDDVAPTVWPERNVMAVHTAAPGWFGEVGKVEGPPIVDWKFNHALLRFVKFDNVQIAEAWKVTPPPWGQVLVETTDSPLMLAGELGRQRVVWLGFDTLQSTWPLRISFPIFIANAADYLNPASARTSQLSVQAGQPFRFALATPVPGAEVVMPGGERRPVAVDPSATELVFGQTARQGIYRISAGTNQLAFCVNLLDAAESDLFPRAELKLGDHLEVAATGVRQANLEIWRWVAALGVAVLLFEWWFYHRRTA